MDHSYNHVQCINRVLIIGWNKTWLKICSSVSFRIRVSILIIIIFIFSFFASFPLLLFSSIFFVDIYIISNNLIMFIIFVRIIGRFPFISSCFISMISEMIMITITIMIFIIPIILSIIISVIIISIIMMITGSIEIVSEIGGKCFCNIGSW